MELIGSIANQGTLQGQINDANGYLTGVITNAGLLGGQVVAERGLKGDKGDTGNGIASIAKTGSSGDIDTYTITFTDGDTTTFTVTNGHTPVITQTPVATDLWTGTAIYVDGVYLTTIMDGNDGQDGADGYSPIANVAKVGDTATITITDEDGTTTATITDGQDGIDGQDGVDGHSPVVTASKVGKVTTVYVDGSPIATLNDGNDGVGIPVGGTIGQVLTKDSGTDYDVSWEDPSGGTITDVTVDGTSIVDDGVAELETVTQLRDGLMTSLDKQKLDGIASGAEVNVNADWDAVSGDAQILNKPTIPSKTSDLNNDSGFITGMTILSYGNSTWQNFIDAYNANKVVYCRASSNSNPASGSQTRLAFMAYVNNATTPTEVEFQYYRSIATHSASQQGDQVFVYKLNKTNGWSVLTREATTKILPSTGLQSSYSNGTLTITAPHDTTKQDTLVSGTNIKTINNTSLLGSGDITVSAEDEIFVCEYGDTTFADALVAYNAGKRLVCHYNDGTNDFFVWLVICDSDSTYFWFEVTSGDKRMEFCLDSNGWTRDDISASAIPIARRISKFNSDARINSMDMTSSEVEDFVDELNVGASGLLDMFYPVGSIYQTVDDGFNPNTRWGGTWELIEEGRFLQATETSQTGGDEVEAGLPNITGNWWGGYGEKSPAGGSGALFVYSNGSYKDGFGTGWKTGLGISLDASRSSSIYGKSNTVQPSAIKVYMWHRTA